MRTVVMAGGALVVLAAMSAPIEAASASVKIAYISVGKLFDGRLCEIKPEILNTKQSFVLLRQCVGWLGENALKVCLSQRL